MEFGCAYQVLLLQLLLVELLPHMLTLAIGHQSHSHSSTPSKFWMVHLKDASGICGEGCVQFQLEDIIKTVPSMEHMNKAYFYFYEDGDKPSWTEYLENPHAYEVFTINHRGERHHTITTFYPDCEEFYNTGWRAVDIAHKVRQWRTETSTTKSIRLKIRRVGGDPSLQTHFKYDPIAKPLLLIGLGDYKEPQKLIEQKARKREKRSTTITRSCADKSNTQPCCLTKERIDTRESKHARLRGIWVSPEVFDFYYCLGTCADHGETTDFYRMLLQVNANKQVCCNAKDREAILVKIWGEANTLIDAEIQNFKVLSCECS